MISIALVGTSNSILKDGFSSGISENKFCRLTNISLGASSSAVGIWAIEKIDFIEYDFVIIDLLNNEEHIIYSGFNVIDRAIGNIVTLLNQCSLGRAVPIIVSFPRKFFLSQNCNLRPLHEAVMELSRSLSIVKFDLYDFVERVIVLKSEVSLNDLFLDEAHLKRPIAKLIGAAIAELLINKCNDGFVVNKYPHKIKYNPAKYIGADCNALNSKGIERRNDFTKENFSQLQEGGRYVFDFGSEESYLTAIHCNAGVSNGALFVNGQRAMGPAPESKVDNNRLFLSVIRLLPKPILVKGVCNLEVVNELGLDGVPVCELSGFVLQKLGAAEEGICVANCPELSDVGVLKIINDDFMDKLDSLMVY